MQFIFIAVGAGLWTWVYKRQFERRNVYGVEEFRSFWQMLMANGFDLVLVLIGLFCFLIGLVMIVF
jgi:hypothetical protein